MSYFNNLILTTKGQEMLLSSNTNVDKVITFTNAGLGSGKLLSEEIKKAIDIKNSWIKFPLNSVRIINDKDNYLLRVEIAFTNSGLTENKIMKELGIYAKFQDTDEVLFAYSTTDDDGETIPSESIVPATYKFTIDSNISTESKIEQLINPEGFLTKEIIELLKENIRNIGFRKIKGTLVEGQKVIQVPTGAELVPLSNRAILNIEGDIYFLERDYTIDTHANTITLNNIYNFKAGTLYEVIDPLPASYVREQIQTFINDFKELVVDSKVDFEKLRDEIYIEFEDKLKNFYSDLDTYIEEHKEELKGNTGLSASEDWLQKNPGKTYEDYLLSIKGDRGNGIANSEYVGTTENGDAKYVLVLEDGTKTTETFTSPRGQKGDSFYIAKTYSSIVEMESDFINEDINFGEYVVISSNDKDNGKLFEKRNTSFEFVVNMGGLNLNLTPATKTSLGSVIIGDNITVDKEGKISVEIPDIAELPIASKTGIGGVRVGVNMQINPDGVINPIYPISTKNGRGIVQIGEGINIDNGKISVGGSFRYNSSSVIFNKVDGEEMLERNNTAVGNEALFKTSSGTDNTAFGSEALCDRRYSASGNTALGSGSLRNLQYGDFNTAVGFQSGEGINDFSFTTCLGYRSTVTGDHQLQLGDRSTTAYCYGSVQNRSDERDKTDIKDTRLGLGFIMKLKPREYRFDYRESYRNYQEIDKIRKKIEKLNKKGRKINRAEALKIFDIESIKKDGSKKGWRLHQGFIAQEVFQTMRELGVDFGGYQDHSINGGKEVLSIGYTEFIPVLTKAIQEQQKQINELVKEMQQIKKHMEKTNE